MWTTPTYLHFLLSGSSLLFLWFTVIVFVFFPTALPGCRGPILLGDLTVFPRFAHAALIYLLQLLKAIQVFWGVPGFFEVGQDLGSDASPVPPDTDKEVTI